MEARNLLIESLQFWCFGWNSSWYLFQLGSGASNHRSRARAHRWTIIVAQTSLVAIAWIKVFCENKLRLENLNNSLVHLNSFWGNSLMRTSLTLSGDAHRGADPLRPLFFNQSENQARWQLQMNGFCTKFLKIIEISYLRAFSFEDEVQCVKRSEMIEGSWHDAGNVVVIQA